jgi:hypothetical protein
MLTQDLQHTGIDGPFRYKIGDGFMFVRQHRARLGAQNIKSQNENKKYNRTFSHLDSPMEVIN